MRARQTSQVGLLGAETEGSFPGLDFGAFRKMKRVLYVDAKIADRAFDFGVAEQDLHGT